MVLCFIVQFNSYSSQLSDIIEAISRESGKERWMNITVYCGSSMGSDPEYKIAAEQLGIWIAKKGHTLVYGGGNVGLMGIIADTVLQNGGRVIGIIPEFLLHCEQGHEGLHSLEVVDSMSVRKKRMIELGDAFVAMPGGIGTLEEITEVLTLRRLRQTEKRAFLYNINGYYEPLRRTFQQMVDKDLLPQEEMELFEFVRDVGELEKALNK